MKRHVHEFEEQLSVDVDANRDELKARPHDINYNYVRGDLTWAQCARGYTWNVGYFSHLRADERELN